MNPVLFLVWIALSLPANASPGQSTAAVRNFRSVNAMMSAVTGVPESRFDDYYNSIRGNLPAEGVISELSPQAEFALTGLAVAYCKAMVDQDAKIPAGGTRRAHDGVDFTAPPSGLTPEIRKAVIGRYAHLFWRRGPSDGEVSAVLAAMDASYTAPVETTPDPKAAGKKKKPEKKLPNLGFNYDTQSILVVGCSSMLASLESIRN